MDIQDLLPRTHDCDNGMKRSEICTKVIVAGSGHEVPPKEWKRIPDFRSTCRGLEPRVGTRIPVPSPDCEVSVYTEQERRRGMIKLGVDAICHTHWYTCVFPGDMAAYKMKCWRMRDL